MRVIDRTLNSFLETCLKFYMAGDFRRIQFMVGSVKSMVKCLLSKLLHQKEKAVAFKKDWCWLRHCKQKCKCILGIQSNTNKDELSLFLYRGPMKSNDISDWSLMNSILLSALYHFHFYSCEFVLTNSVTLGSNGLDMETRFPKDQGLLVVNLTYWPSQNPCPYLS